VTRCVAFGSALQSGNMKKKQDSTSAGSGACLQREGRSGRRHWFRVTGLPGWRRAQLGVPAFGEAECAPPRKPGFRPMLLDYIWRIFARRTRGTNTPVKIATPVHHGRRHGHEHGDRHQHPHHFHRAEDHGVPSKTTE
jgi:hypothetical protein